MYLRSFSDATEQVMLVRRNPPHRAHRSAVHNAITEAGFYRIETEHLALESDREMWDPESVEDGLSVLENMAAPAIQKVLRGEHDRFDKNDWYRLVQFTALQTTRGNRWRENVITLVSAHLQAEYLADLDEDAISSWLAQRGMPSSPSDVVDFISLLASPRFPRVLPPHPVLVQESIKMGIGSDDDPGVAGFLADKPMRVIRPRNVNVLTSDEPVFWWSPDSEAPAYAEAHAVWLPLSPGVILEFRNRDHDEPSLPDDADELAAFVNERVAGQAHRWIVHHPDQTPLAGIKLPERLADRR